YTFLDDGLAFDLAHRSPLLGAVAADLRFDLVEPGDAPECFFGDRGSSTFGDFVDPPPPVCPAEGQDHGIARAPSIGQLLVGRIPVALHDAPSTGEQRHRMLASARRREGINSGRRARAAAPGTVVARDRPEVAGLSAPAAGI